jgi:hypothetical protein
MGVFVDGDLGAEYEDDYIGSDRNAFDYGVLSAPSPALPEKPPPVPPALRSMFGMPTPNPADRRVALPYGIGQASYARLAVYDALGRMTALPVTGEREPEEGEVVLDVSGWAPGVYAVVLEAGGAVEMRRFTVVR